MQCNSFALLLRHLFEAVLLRLRTEPDYLISFTVAQYIISADNAELLSSLSDFPQAQPVVMPTRDDVTATAAAAAAAVAPPPASCQRWCRYSSIYGDAPTARPSTHYNQFSSAHAVYVTKYRQNRTHVPWVGRRVLRSVCLSLCLSVCLSASLCTRAYLRLGITSSNFTKFYVRVAAAVRHTVIGPMCMLPVAI